MTVENMSWRKRRTLSLAREANDQDIKNIEALSKECDQVRAKLFALSKTFDSLGPSGDAAEALVKAALLCRQAVALCKEAISELG